MNTSETSRNVVEIRWDSVDRHQSSVTLAALVLVVTAVMMAVVGLPPVDLHGPLHQVGIMDPLCGGTRAAWYTAQGQLVQAWRYNPLGIVVVVGSMLLVARALLGLVSRLWLNVHVEMTARSRRVVFTTFAILIALLEIRQQGRAELLMAATHAAGA